METERENVLLQQSFGRNSIVTARMGPICERIAHAPDNQENLDINCQVQESTRMEIPKVSNVVLHQMHNTNDLNMIGRDSTIEMPRDSVKNREMRTQSFLALTRLMKKKSEANSVRISRADSSSLKGKQD